MSSNYTEDHLVEQPAIQLMQHELGWDVVNCYDDPSSLTILRRGYERQELRRTGWSGGVSNQGRDGKREEVEILNVGFLILNGRGRDQAGPRLNPDLPVDHSSPPPSPRLWRSRRLRMARAIEGAVEERGILNVGFLILNGRGRRPPAPRLNQNSEEVEG